MLNMSPRMLLCPGVEFLSVPSHSNLYSIAANGSPGQVPMLGSEPAGIILHTPWIFSYRSRDSNLCSPDGSRLYGMLGQHFCSAGLRDKEHPSSCPLPCSPLVPKQGHFCYSQSRALPLSPVGPQEVAYWAPEPLDQEMPS